MKTEELRKEIRKLIKQEEECMKQDTHEEQVLEHMNQIAMANKILNLINNNSKIPNTYGRSC